MFQNVALSDKSQDPPHGNVLTLLLAFNRFQFLTFLKQSATGKATLVAV